MSDEEDGNTNDNERQYYNLYSANNDFSKDVHSPSYQDQLEGWKQLNAEFDAKFGKKDGSG